MADVDMPDADVGGSKGKVAGKSAKITPADTSVGDSKKRFEVKKVSLSFIQPTECC